MTVRAFYIGPESNVWHAARECPRLRASHRYYPLREVTGRKAEEIRATRRACRVCCGVYAK